MSATPTIPDSTPEPGPIELWMDDTDAEWRRRDYEFAREQDAIRAHLLATLEGIAPLLRLIAIRTAAGERWCAEPDTHERYSVAFREVVVAIAKARGA